MYVNFQAKTARERGGSGVGFDNYQRSGIYSDNCQRSRVPKINIKKSYKSSISTFKQNQQWSGVGPGLVLIITKGPGLILIIAKGLGYLKTNQEVRQVISINFQAKAAVVRGGSGVNLDNCQRSGVDSDNCQRSGVLENYIKKSYKSSLSTFKQKQQWSGVGPGLILIIAKGPGYLDVRQVMYVNF